MSCLQNTYTDSHTVGVRVGRTIGRREAREARPERRVPIYSWKWRHLHVGKTSLTLVSVLAF